MKDITELMVELRTVTIELIGFLNIRNYDEINFSINRRQEIIERLQKFKCSKEELENKASEMNILELDKKAIELTQEKLDFVKEKLIQINTVEFVKDKYHYGTSNNSKFFNKKI